MRSHILFFLFLGISGSIFSQNVGINVPVPIGKLHIKVNSTTSLPHIRLTEDEDDFARIKMENTQYQNSFWDIAARTNSTADFAKLNFYFKNATNSGDRMTITGLGKVGIGNSSPKATLDVNGKIILSDDSYSPVEGSIRWNSIDNCFEGYNGSEWILLGGKKQKILTISMAEFQGNATGDPLYVDKTFPSGAYIEDENVFKFDNNMYIPLSFATGTKIDSTIIYFYDNDSESNIKISDCYFANGLGCGVSVSTSGAQSVQRKIKLINNLSFPAGLGRVISILPVTNLGGPSSWKNGALRIERAVVYYRE